jgi:hypothetical protein
MTQDAHVEDVESADGRYGEEYLLRLVHPNGVDEMNQTGRIVSDTDLCRSCSEGSCLASDQDVAGEREITGRRAFLWIV